MAAPKDSLSQEGTDLESTLPSSQKTPTGGEEGQRRQTSRQQPEERRNRDTLYIYTTLHAPRCAPHPFAPFAKPQPCIVSQAPRAAVPFSTPAHPASITHYS
ncbi:Protein of unknown function [Pyronema omphalodes CBS 100304]|uniref:Uncharacterized protein n=1 Tax=Pyronema omphalodes (strain CBS 100304) TaxID=1076935 RepID=U4LIW0_PYROM|nr:Protein of unknown function [Pyronema omphalodes CBS 100304]